MIKPFTLLLAFMCLAIPLYAQQPVFKDQEIFEQKDVLHTRSGNTSLRLNATQNRSFLLSEPMEVKRGQQLQLEVYAHYVGKARSKTVAKVATTIAAVTLATVLSNEAANPQKTGDNERISKGLPLLGLGLALPTALFAAHKRVPKAYLQYLLYDKQGHYLNSKAVGIGKGAKNNWQALQLQQLVKQDGYVRVLLANESKADVWMDDLSVRVIATDITPEVASGRAARQAVETALPGGGVITNNIENGDDPLNDPTKPEEDEMGVKGGDGSFDNPFQLSAVTVTAQGNATYSNQGGGVSYFSGGTYSVSNGSYSSTYYYESGYYQYSGASSSDPVENGPRTSTPKNPQDGESYTYRDTYGTLVTLVYNKAANVWVLPVVTVPGTPPANPFVGTRYEFGNNVLGSTYYWTGKTWGKLDRSGPSDKKPQYYPSKNVEDDTNNPCVHEILQKLLDSRNNIFSDILNKTYGNDSKSTLTFFLDPTLTSPNAETQLRGPKGDIVVDIAINPKLFEQGASKESMASTIIHELIHAYFDYEHNYNATAGIPVNEEDQHEYMAKNYVDDMTKMVETLFPDFTSKHPNVAEALAWGGLEETDAFKALTATKQRQIKEINSRESALPGFKRQGTECK